MYIIIFKNVINNAISLKSAQIYNKFIILLSIVK